MEASKRTRTPSIAPCGCPDYIETGGVRFNAGEYGYPFFLYDGTVYIAPVHSGHKKYAPVLAAQIGVDVTELTENVRHRHTTGRIYPSMEAFGGKTVITVWCDSEKTPHTFMTIAEAVMSYYTVKWDDLLFVNRKGAMDVSPE